MRQPPTPAKVTTTDVASQRDQPWLFRTYAGHSTAAKSNALYRRNLAKGQTGLSIAFDLPTQTGYDPDHVLARGEVGKVGVPVSHIGDMRTLFDQIPLATMNTSMTINATAAWLLALLIFAVVLSASRTGMLGVLALAVWGALDRTLSRRSRLMLCMSPLIYALCWGGLTTWANLSGHVFGGAARLRRPAHGMRDRRQPNPVHLHMRRPGQADIGVMQQHLGAEAQRLQFRRGQMVGDHVHRADLAESSGNGTLPPPLAPVYDQIPPRSRNLIKFPTADISPQKHRPT